MTRAALGSRARAAAAARRAQADPEQIAELRSEITRRMVVAAYRLSSPWYPPEDAARWLRDRLTELLDEQDKT